LRSRTIILFTGIVVATLWSLRATQLHAAPGDAQGPLQQTTKTGRDLYDAACAACHGADGRGVTRTTVGFETPLPDFTDCSFGTREPDADWAAVIHDGGPARAFAEIMPAFGEALSEEQISGLVDHLRTFCRDANWPRGDLNLPRLLVTEKAFPEDEAVWTTAIAAEGPGAIENKFVYEKRFGPRNQIEFVVPFAIQKPGGAGWSGGVGDIAVGFKRALFHDLDTGTIFSAGGEVVFPSGNQSRGFGKGVTVFEPFVAFGKILPKDSFFQFQGGFELPVHDVEKEAFFRFAGGRTWVEGSFGRSWTPMVELLGAREFATGAQTAWDLLPQVQITLNKRQHIMLNVGVRVPVNNSGQRNTQILFYLLWDWFDGGLRDGW
jgi:mono/diheme cytochrome c family protein